MPGRSAGAGCDVDVDCVFESDGDRKFSDCVVIVSFVQQKEVNAADDEVTERRLLASVTERAL